VQKKAGKLTCFLWGKALFAIHSFFLITAENSWFAKLYIIAHLSETSSVSMGVGRGGALPPWIFKLDNSNAFFN